MSCEVHLVLDPIAPSFRVVPWRRLAGQAIEVELPSGKATVLVIQRSAGDTAQLRAGGRTCELRGHREEPTARTEWFLPDSGYLLVNDQAFSYPTGCWYNRR